MPDLPSNQSTNIIAGSNVTIVFTETEGDYWDIEFSAASSSGAPDDADYLVGTANGTLSNEIVVGTTPGGELGGTWGSPTVDTTHSGSSHAGAVTFENLDANGDVGTNASQVAEGDHTHGAGTEIAIEEDNVAVGNAATVDFGTGFDVTVAASEAEIAIDLSEISAFTDHSARHENGGADEISLAGLDGTPTDLQTHLDDTADAHDASAISVLDTAAQITATDVEGALAEIVDTEQAHVADADPHTGYRLESADHTHQSTGAQAGQLDHGLALTGLTDDDHTQYRLESADHTHQSTGLQGGTLDHGLALTGLTDDDHTQYMLESTANAKGDIFAASADNTPAILSVGTAGQRLTPNTGAATGLAWADDTFTVGGVLLDPSGARTVEVWRAPFSCEVTAYHARVVGGTNAVTNAQVDSTDILTGDLTTTPADGWEAGTIKSDGTEDITAGEIIKLEVVSISGSVTEVSWTITLRRAA